MENLISSISSIGGTDRVLRLVLYLLKLVELRRSHILTRTFGGDIASIIIIRTNALTSLIASLADARSILNFPSFALTVQSERESTWRQLASKQRWEWNDYNRALKSACSVAFYPLDNLSWLSKHGLLVSSDLGILASKWSCRFWALYTALDIYDAYAIEENGRATGASDNDATMDLKATESTCGFCRKWNVAQLKAAANWCDLVLALNWSFERSFISPDKTAIIGAISSVCRLVASTSQ